MNYCSSTGFNLCLSWLPVYCCWYSRGLAGVSYCSSTGFSFVSQFVTCMLLLAVEVLLG